MTETHTPADPPDAAIDMKHYSAALTEIFRLRAALAREADLRRRDLRLKTYPRGRRAVAELAIKRMEAAARGGVANAYPTPDMTNKDALTKAGADDCLTRHDWERHVDQNESDLS